MADRIADLTVRVRVVEEKVDSLDKKVDHLDEKVDNLAASVDRRFDAVDAAFVEQRQYTEFAFSKLEAKMDAGFARVDSRFSQFEAKMDAGFDRMDARFGQVDARFSGIERKLDHFLNVQGEANEAQRQANQVAERRLSALEQRPA